MSEHSMHAFSEKLRRKKAEERKQYEEVMTSELEKLHKNLKQRYTDVLNSIGNDIDRKVKPLRRRL